MGLNKRPFNEDIIAEWLVEIIRREMEKPDGEADMDLVEECEKSLESLDVCDAYTEEELDTKLQKLFAEKNKKISGHDRKRRRFRRIAAIAAVVAVLIGGTVSAYAFIPEFQDVVRMALNMPRGSSGGDENITYYHHGESKTYSLLDELINDLGLDILYPRNLPDDIKIEEIISEDVGTGLYLIFTFNDKSMSITVEIDPGIDVEELAESNDALIINGVTSYVKEYAGICTAVIVKDGYVYYVSSGTREKTITLFESLE